MGPCEDRVEKRGVGFSVAPERIGACTQEPPFDSHMEQKPSQVAPVRL
jgi:hypothetical protein